MPFQPPEESPGDRVRRQRKRLGLEIRELADRAGVNKATIVRVESGGGSSDDTWAKLARALDAPEEWLRHGTLPS